ncbi:superoxide dismutase [Deinococcus sp.]|uniref:superoxide dismutase n=1 Tax=Deinococcus sp. TaxID=47478 RepID=UPI002869B3C0|nr:superoxide dismutase [Deinococcus sp.]
MFRLLVLPTLALALSACSMSMMGKPADTMSMADKPADTMAMMDKPTDYTLGKQPAGNALTSSGTVSMSHSGSMVMTTAKVMGFAPNTYYVAHYHKQGAASTDACASGGDAILASKLVGKSDDMGMLTLTGSVAADVIKDATYFNIHTASGADGTPADAGVSCTAIAKMM